MVLRGLAVSTVELDLAHHEEVHRGRPGGGALFGHLCLCGRPYGRHPDGEYRHPCPCDHDHQTRLNVQTQRTAQHHVANYRLLLLLLCGHRHDHDLRAGQPSRHRHLHHRRVGPQVSLAWHLFRWATMVLRGLAVSTVELDPHHEEVHRGRPGGGALFGHLCLCGRPYGRHPDGEYRHPCPCDHDHQTRLNVQTQRTAQHHVANYRLLLLLLCGHRHDHDLRADQHAKHQLRRRRRGGRRRHGHDHDLRAGQPSRHRHLHHRRVGRHHHDHGLRAGQPSTHRHLRHRRVGRRHHPCEEAAETRSWARLGHHHRISNPGDRLGLGHQTHGRGPCLGLCLRRWLL
mmetsp:Transcript_10909/g.23810  ORF Transcript_10909/g.23810 Transcript_10909/m.23810 type:complete len:343 (-) Transcript_10909:529-1557(-)